MSKKSFSMASSPLTEMCIAICQPASDHFFKTLSQAACICMQSVCTELLVTQSWKRYVWRTKSHYPSQDTLRFHNFSSPILVCILTPIFERQPVPSFYINWFQFRQEYRIKDTENNGNFQSAAEPQNKQTKCSSEWVQNRKLRYFSVIKKINGYKKCLLLSKVLSFPF